jgi:hypothetical protein
MNYISQISNGELHNIAQVPPKISLPPQTSNNNMRPELSRASPFEILET